MNEIKFSQKKNLIVRKQKTIIQSYNDIIYPKVAIFIARIFKNQVQALLFF